MKEKHLNKALFLLTLAGLSLLKRPIVLEANTLTLYPPAAPEELGWTCSSTTLPVGTDGALCGKNSFTFGLYENFPQNTSTSARQGGYSIIKENGTFYLTWSGEHYLTTKPNQAPTESYINLYNNNRFEKRIEDTTKSKAFNGRVLLSDLSRNKTYTAQHCIVVDGIKDCRWIESKQNENTQFLAGEPYSVIMASNTNSSFAPAPKVMRFLYINSTLARGANLTWIDIENKAWPNNTNKLTFWTDAQAQANLTATTKIESLLVYDRLNADNYSNAILQIRRNSDQGLVKTYDLVTKENSVPNCYSYEDDESNGYSCNRGLQFLLTKTDLNSLPAGEYYFRTTYDFTNKSAWGSAHAPYTVYSEYHLVNPSVTQKLPDSFRINNKEYSFRFAYDLTGTLLLTVSELGHPELTITAPNNWVNDATTVTFNVPTSGQLVAIKNIYFRLSGATTKDWTEIKNGGSFPITNSGVTTVEAYYIDVNNQQSKTFSKDVKIDKTSPTVTLSAPTDISNSEIAITTNISDAGGSGVRFKTYAVQKDDGTQYPDFQIPDDGIILIDEAGINYVTATITDNAGNQSSQTIKVIIDRTAPTPSGTITPEATATRESLVTLRHTDNYRVGYLEYFVSKSAFNGNTNQSWVRYSAPFKLTDHGRFFVHYRAVDAAGNISPVYTLEGENDSQPPTITINSPTLFSNKNISLSATAVDDVAVKSFEYLMTGAQATDGWQSYSNNSNLTVLNDGVTVVSFRAEDFPGNRSEKSVTLTLDSSAPKNTITATTDWSKNDVSVTVEVQDIGEAKLQEAYYQLNNGAKQDLLSSNGQKTFTISSEGETTVSLYGRDKATNETLVEKIIRIDKTDPTGQILSIEGCTNLNEVTATLQASDNLSGVASSKYRLIGATTKDWTAYPSGTVISISNTGETTIEIEVIDQAGNKFSTTKTIIISRQSPNTFIATNETWTNNSSVPATLQVSHPSSYCPIIQKEYRLTGATTKDWTSYNDGALINISNAGETLIEVRATDQAGNSSSDRKTVRIDRTNPTVTITANENWSNKASDTVTISLGDTGGSGINYGRYRLSGASDGNWVIISTNTTLTISTEGETTISANVYDYAGNSAVATPKTLRLDQSGPLINITHDGTGGWQNTPINISTTFIDKHSGLNTIINPDDQTITPTNSTEFTLKHVARLNDYYFFKATDQVGNTSEKYVLIEKIDMYKPLINLNAKTTWTNQNVTLTIEGVNPVIDPNENLYN